MLFKTFLLSCATTLVLGAGDSLIDSQLDAVLDNHNSGPGVALTTACNIHEEWCSNENQAQVQEERILAALGGANIRIQGWASDVPSSNALQLKDDEVLLGWPDGTVLADDPNLENGEPWGEEGLDPEYDWYVLSNGWSKQFGGSPDDFPLYLNEWKMSTLQVDDPSAGHQVVADVSGTKTCCVVKNALAAVTDCALSIVGLFPPGIPVERACRATGLPICLIKAYSCEEGGSLTDYCIRVAECMVNAFCQRFLSGALWIFGGATCAEFTAVVMGLIAAFIDAAEQLGENASHLSMPLRRLLQSDLPEITAEAVETETETRGIRQVYYTMKKLGTCFFKTDGVAGPGPCLGAINSISNTDLNANNKNAAGPSVGFGTWSANCAKCVVDRVNMNEATTEEKSTFGRNCVIVDCVDKIVAVAQLVECLYETRHAGSPYAAANTMPSCDPCTLDTGLVESFKSIAEPNSNSKRTGRRPDSRSRGQPDFPGNP